jgi:hypothetical protein
MERKTADQRHSIAIIANERSNMGIFTNDIKSMEDLLIHSLQDIYYAEHRSSNRFPR